MSRLTRQILILLGIWLVFSLVVSVSGIFERVTAIVLPIAVWSPVFAIMLVFWQSADFRQWIYQADLRYLILYHLTRFVGIWFLVLYKRGELPYAFAVPGGWGDIAVAVSALVVAFLFVPVRSRLGWWVVVAWNTFGLIDILMVVSTAARLALADLNSMAALIRFPLSLLPLFIVPLIIASHLIIYASLWRQRTA